MRRSLRFLLWLAPLIILLPACSHPRVPELEASIGNSTQDELIHRFGYPQRLKRLPSGVEVWEYEFLAGQSRCVGYRVFFDLAQRSERWQEIPCH